MVRETHPHVAIAVEITILVEGFGFHQHAQRMVYGNGVEQHAERVGTHLEAVTVEITADIVRKTGAEQHNAVVVSDFERELRSGYIGTE